MKEDYKKAKEKDLVIEKLKEEIFKLKLDIQISSLEDYLFIINE